jgi:hypothetical protein
MSEVLFSSIPGCWWTPGCYIPPCARELLCLARHRSSAPYRAQLFVIIARSRDKQIACCVPHVLCPRRHVVRRPTRCSPCLKSVLLATACARQFTWSHLPSSPTLQLAIVARSDCPSSSLWPSIWSSARIRPLPTLSMLLSFAFMLCAIASSFFLHVLILDLHLSITLCRSTMSTICDPRPRAHASSNVTPVLARRRSSVVGY